MVHIHSEHGNAMYLSRALLVVIISALATSCSSSKSKSLGALPWGPDFEKEGQLTKVITCDGGKTKYKAYDGPWSNTLDPYRGATVSINGAVRYYVFSPNLSSATSPVFSFRKSIDGKLENISSEALGARLQNEAPNLIAFMYAQENDCREE